MSHRIDCRLRNALFSSLLLAVLVWGAVPPLQAGVTAGANSGHLAGSGNSAETASGITATKNSVTSASGTLPENVPELLAQTSLSADGPTLPAAAHAQAQPRYNTIGTSGDVLYEPTALAIDASGNVWVASYVGGVTEFSPLGALLSPTTGYAATLLNESYGLTIDMNSNVWVTSEETPSPRINNSYGNITELDSSGNVLSGTDGYYGGGVYFPVAVASDTLGRIWVANNSDSATLLSNSGASISPSSGYASSGQLFFSDAVAVDANNNAWFGNFSSKYITQVAPDGTVLNQVSCCNATSSLAIDQSGNVWAADYYSNKISEVSSTGTVLSTGYTGGGLDHPYKVAIDGKGNVWAVNYLGNSITELQGASGSAPGSALSPATGIGTAAGLVEPMALAIDASGNVWVTNNGSNTLTMFVGAAAPVQTPMVGPAKLP